MTFRLQTLLFFFFFFLMLAKLQAKANRNDSKEIIFCCITMSEIISPGRVFAAFSLFEKHSTTCVITVRNGLSAAYSLMFAVLNSLPMFSTTT